MGFSHTRLGLDHGHPGTAREHVPCPLAHVAHGPPGPARLHSARQAWLIPRTGTPRQRAQAWLVNHGTIHTLCRTNTISPQVAPDIACSHCPPGPTMPRPGPGLSCRLGLRTARMGRQADPFASHLLTRESRGQGVFLQMGGPPNTFTGATQPIPVGSDGSVQAGLPDANAGRDTRGVVNKYSTPRCVSPHAMRLRVR